MDDDKEAEDALREFAAITGTDEAFAHSILQDVDWDLQKALTVFFDGDAPAVHVPSAATSKEVPGNFDVTGLEVSFLSWNIDGLDLSSLPTRMKAVHAIVSRTNADFVFLQEVVEREIGTIDSLKINYNMYYSNRGAQYFTAIGVSKIFDVIEHKVIFYSNSRMERTLQIIQGRIGELDVFLLNTHLESMREHSDIRREQIRECFGRMQSLSTSHPNALIIFGGDLNIRDDEIPPVPSGFADAWIAAGSDKQYQYTWDTRKNDNKGYSGGRCRFDRIFWKGPLDKVQFSLTGQQRIRSCLAFPSDHWAVQCTFSK